MRKNLILDTNKNYSLNIILTPTQDVIKNIRKAQFHK